MSVSCSLFLSKKGRTVEMLKKIEKKIKHKKKLNVVIVVSESPSFFFSSPPVGAFGAY